MSVINSLSTYSPLSNPPVTGAQSSLSQLSAKSNQDIDAVARDFESVFLSQMLQHMFAGEEANSFFGNGAAGDIYKSYLMNEYGKSISNAGGIGIASTVKEELLKLQEVPSA